MNKPPPISTKEGWAAFVQSEPVPPLPPPTEEELAALDDEQRRDLQRRRRTYHSQLRIYATGTIKQLQEIGRDLIEMNEASTGSPMGVALSGPSGVGKTTALHAFGKSYERYCRLHEPERQHPVLYVPVPPSPTSRKVCEAFCNFLALPSSGTDSALRTSIQATTSNGGTSVVLLDDANHLDWGDKHALGAADQLKSLSDFLEVTFVLAGLNLESSSVFTGPRSRQISGRYTMLRVHPYRNRTKAEGATWRNLLRSFEDHLRLRDHEAGTLEGLGDYLYRRTTGHLGSLTRLLRLAAVAAIRSGAERIDESVLEKVQVDADAERRMESAERLADRQQS
jgi:DNA transposition AAA+ family ATPase